MSMATAMIACGGIGAIMVAGTILMGHPSARGPAFAASEDYGRRLMLRPLGESHLACTSCHIDAGAEPGELSLVHAIENDTRIAGRINRCMTGNMNGRALQTDAPEMAGLIAWLHFLSDRYVATGASEREAHDPPPFQQPSRAANVASGEALFEKRCADCHGEDGAGLPATWNSRDGYVFPPLWGPESFNSSAEMAEAVIAARFIKAKMPPGSENLDNDQAFDVAAFIESKPRPSR
jgi:thiosulfate dehydrogenase